LHVLNEICKNMFTPPSIWLTILSVGNYAGTGQTDRSYVAKQSIKEILARFVIDSDKIEKFPLGIVASLAHNCYAILSDSTKGALTP
jgi:hypothetical protein